MTISRLIPLTSEDRTDWTRTTALFVHGGPGLSHHYLIPYVTPLSERFNIAFWDYSRIPKGDTKVFFKLVEELAATLSALVARGPLLVAIHSWGCIPFLSTLLRQETPPKLKRVVLMNPIPQESSRLASVQARLLVKATDEDLMDSGAVLGLENHDDARRLFQRILPSYFAPGRNAPVLDLRFDPAAYFALSHATKNYDLKEAVNKLTAPLSILLGAHDFCRQSDIDTEILRRGDVIPFRESGHFLFAEEPSRFCSTLEQFM